MFHFLSSKHQHVSNVLDQTLTKLQAKDPTLMKAISDQAGTIDPDVLENYRKQIIAQIQHGQDHIASDPKSAAENYASRDPFVSLVQTYMGQQLNALTPAAVDNLANDWQQYGDADPRWAMCPIVSFFTLGKPKAPFVQAGDPTSFTYVEHKQSFTIALMADWGAPNEAAKDISAQIKARQPDYAIHLGDVYYSGTKAECQAVLDMWPLTKPDGTPVVDHSFALNGNHEMFCGARNYFGTILQAFHQPASFFRLKTEYWQIIGLDTAYTGGTLSHVEVQSQWNWLVANLKANSNLSTILLTHHQPVSAHAQESHDAQALKADADNLLTLAGKDSIFGWFFGHEHRAVVYDDTVTGYKARLIGNGAVPHDAQNETQPDPGCTPFIAVNKGTWGSGNAISGFVMLTVNGPKITVEYINQDGTPSTMPTEIWNSLAAGQPLA